MHLLELSLSNFKNIEEARLDFSPGVNCLVGNNGQGKSNLLDAIHYLSYLRSFAGAPDALVVRSGQPFMTARARYIRREIPEEVAVGVVPGKRKSVKRGGKEYKRQAEHIGLFPIVMSAPADSDLVRGSGEERRRWVDMVSSMGSAAYLDSLMRYNRLLEQRNRLLRDHVVDHTLYDAVEFPLAEAARQVADARLDLIAKLTPLVTKYYGDIAGVEEMPALEYASPMADPGVSLRTLLDSARRHDEIVGHTSVGPHRDDITMLLQGMPMRRVASQGQAKTFTIALRLAQFRFLAEATGITPILLLDDIFDKLDASRVEKIMQLVSTQGVGQIFITDTNRTHIDSILHSLSGDHRLFSVAAGQISPL